MARGTEEERSFLGQVVDEFGVQWTSIAVFSSLLFSAFGLDRYIDIAPWMVATVVSFSVAFVFRRQIGAKFLRVAVISILAMIALLSIGYVLAVRTKPLPEYLHHHQMVASLYIGCSLMLPLAILLLSYRQQERYLGVPLPKELDNAVRRGVLESPLYRRDIQYYVTLLQATSRLTSVSVELAYGLVNRTSSSQRTVIALTPIRRKAEFLSARIGGRSYDVSDPQYRTEFGLQIPIVVESNSEASVRIRATITYSSQDADLFCSWLPATSLELHITNPFHQSTWIAVESLLSEKIDPDLAADGTAIYRTTTGLLPHQGFRVSWGPTGRRLPSERPTKSEVAEHA